VTPTAAAGLISFVLLGNSIPNNLGNLVDQNLYLNLTNPLN
jgi:hypothetical protein